MNIFVLDENPTIASRFHVDRHIVKMPLETAQILCTSHWQIGNEAPYKPTHVKHPCNLWVIKSINNYNWLVDLGLELCREYTHRYGKIHKCQAIIEWCKENKPNLPKTSMTQYAVAMPEEFKTNNVVESYRNYYIGGKSHLHNWTNRERPTWITN